MNGLGGDAVSLLSDSEQKSVDNNQSSLDWIKPKQEVVPAEQSVDGEPEQQLEQPEGRLVQADEQIGDQVVEQQSDQSQEQSEQQSEQTQEITIE